MKVDVSNESQTSKMNDSAGAWIVVGQLDREEKAHEKRRGESGAFNCLPFSRPGDGGFLYAREQGSAMYIGPSYLVRVRGKKGDENTKM